MAPHALADDECVFDESVDPESLRQAVPYADKAEEIIRQLGIGESPRPVIRPEHLAIFDDVSEGDYFDGRMPPTIRDLDINQVSYLYTLFANWYSYVKKQAMKWKHRKSEAERRLKFEAARLKKLYSVDDSGKKVSEKLADAMAKNHPDYMEADSDYRMASAVYDMLDAQLSITHRDMTVVSREITIRQLEIEANAKGRGFDRRIAEAAVGRRYGLDNAETEHHEEPPPSTVTKEASKHGKRFARRVDIRKKS